MMELFVVDFDLKMPKRGAEPFCQKSKVKCNQNQWQRSKRSHASEMRQGGGVDPSDGLV